MRLLIVDDSESFLEAARVLLEREGLEVAGVASTSANALRQFEVLHPDVILVDIFLDEESLPAGAPGSEWVEAETIIREIRSYELEAPPRLQSGVCEHCAEAILGRRARVAEAVAA
jgi:DNA-binding NarL/FixJ family response regulator